MTAYLQATASAADLLDLNNGFVIELELFDLDHWLGSAILRTGCVLTLFLILFVWLGSEILSTGCMLKLVGTLCVCVCFLRKPGPLVGSVRSLSRRLVFFVWPGPFTPAPSRHAGSRHEALCGKSCDFNFCL